jgi:hypothetical protein
MSSGYFKNHKEKYYGDVRINYDKISSKVVKGVYSPGEYIEGDNDTYGFSIT